MEAKIPGVQFHESMGDEGEDIAEIARTISMAREADHAKKEEPQPRNSGEGAEPVSARMARVLW